MLKFSEFLKISSFFFCVNFRDKMEGKGVHGHCSKEHRSHGHNTHLNRETDENFE
jgi:hypothetical protein